MDISRSLLKDFAEATNDSSKESTSKYLRGTVKVEGDKKYVQIDGSSMLTPIVETVDVQNNDRVLVSIENHKATILGNFTFPPSARKEEEALDAANDAKEEANASSLKAQEAIVNANQALTESSIASSLADEAKQNAQDAMTAAGNASAAVEETKQLANQAITDATTAKQDAASAMSNVANAQNEIDRINTEVTNVKGDIETTLTELGELDSETQSIKQSLELEYTKKTELTTVEASLKQEISKSVGELQTTISEDYAAKTEVVDLEGRLQSQITQNAEGLTSTASKVEKLESDTTAAQEQVNQALQKAEAAQTAATQAQTNASQAQAAADQAKLDAETAQTKAQTASEAAEAARIAADTADKAVQAAQGDLNEAKQNLALVTSRVDATEQEIADAQAKVDAAQESVNQALADAATANYAANQAQEAAAQAKDEADQAQIAASNAQTKADNAELVANNAQAAADKAQEDVAALTSRVTSAETQISQNAEQIALTASKTEEIGDKLINDYYSKTETDAAINLKADEIELSVTETVTDKIDGMIFGGTNLLSNSSFEKDIDGWVTQAGDGSAPDVEEGTEPVAELPSVEIVTIDGVNCAVINSTSSPFIYQNIVSRLYSKDKVNTYTFAIDVNLADYSAVSNPEAKLYVEGKYTDESGLSQDVVATTLEGTDDITTLANQGWKRIVWTFTLNGVPDSSNNVDYLYVGIKGSGFNGNLYFRYGKVEKGTKANDWSPSPNDYSDEIEDTANETTASITEQYTSLIQQTAEQLDLMIKEIKQTTDEQETSISTISNQLQITSEMAQFVKTTTEQLQDAIDGKLDATSILEWARFDGASLELGASNSPFKCILSNTELAFYQGENKVAWISNNELHVLTAVIATSIGCGNFMFIDEGDLGFSLL